MSSRDEGRPREAAVKPEVTALPADFDAFVSAAAAGAARSDELALLAAHPDAWAATLRRLLAETEEELAQVRRLTGEERDQVVADFEAERRSLTAALSRLNGHAGPASRPGASAPPMVPDAAAEAGPARLQLSWDGGRVVAWAASADAAPLDADEVLAMLVASGAPAGGWSRHQSIVLKDGIVADAFGSELTDVLGWLVALGGDRIGASARWLSQVAVWAVDLVAHGFMVPSLSPPARGASGDRTCSVQWLPALVDQSRLTRVAASAPGAVMAFHRGEARPFTEHVLGAVVDAICTHAADRLEVPAVSHRPQGATQVGEAVLGHLDGSPMILPAQAAAELSARLERWARPVTEAGTSRLIVQLDPPDSGGAWRLAVLAAGALPGQGPVPVEVALVNAPSLRRREVADHLGRLERLLPALHRSGGHRRGEVVVSQDEAWELMTATGRKLTAAGFDVRVPVLSPHRATPSLRLIADAADQSVVGAQQLAQVRWSALFDGVELSGADIARLAAEARPLLRSGSRWVALDHADLAAAAAALSERAKTTQLTGGAMLRHALGLEGSPLAGGVSVEGNGWASQLLRRAEAVSGEPLAAPDGFVGSLRSYQEEALAWLDFLDGSGLGGCLALDMGLGKTPTVLARLLTTAGDGPTLVIAPPAVVGNWAAEAARFTPGLRVVIHHGSGRESAAGLGDLAARADVVLTTYGTAVRDVDALAAVRWDRVVIDEAQAIKNPASETAQQLRRIPARCRVALTGTPIENGLGDLWSILDFTNPGLVGSRPQFISHLSGTDQGDGAVPAAERALRALNGLLVFRRTKAEPAIAAELPERIDELDHCVMTTEQIGLYQAVLDRLITGDADGHHTQGEILAAITALKQICNHPAAYRADDDPLADRSGKLARLEEIVHAVFSAGERLLVFTHFAQWGQQLAEYLTERTGVPISCYDGSLNRQTRDRMVSDFQTGTGPGALVLSLKAGGTGLNLTAASHVVLYDRWWNPAVEDQARDRAWRIGQTRTVVCHRLVCPGTVDERVEEVVAGKRRIAELVLPKSSSLGDLDAAQLRAALGLRPDTLLAEDVKSPNDEVEAA